MSKARFHGGIDLGGTKIETVLFDGDLRPVKTTRRATPKESYAALVAALAEEIAALRAGAGDPGLPVGLGLPGIVDPDTGLALTSNIPATGRPFAADLAAAAGGTVVLGNDCKCFALSEANGGSGAGFHTVFGLVLGTGVGGGMCQGGRLIAGRNGIAGEVGHQALPAHVIADLGLPLLPCGCGRTGCAETYASGTGLSALARVLAGADVAADVVAGRAASGDAAMARVMAAWARLTGELLHGIQLHLDPDCIVLGGGLSNIAGIEAILSEALGRAALPMLRLPVIRRPMFGDSSGTRGAAILAAQAG